MENPGLRINYCFDPRTWWIIQPYYPSKQFLYGGALNIWHLNYIDIFFCVFHTFSVPANFRSLVYFYGIKNGGVKEWDFAFGQFQNTTVASERRKILYGLSGASEPWIIRRYGINYPKIYNPITLLSPKSVTS